MKSTTPGFPYGKQIALFVFFWGTIIFNSLGQTYVNGDYQSVTSGTWATAAVWQKYNGTAWLSATAPAANYSAGTIYIQTGTTVSIAAAISQGSLYINGGAFTVNSGITFTVSNGPGATDININSGTFTNNGTVSILAGAAIANSGSVINNSGASFIMSGISVTNNTGGVITNSGTLTNNAANTLSNSGALNNNNILNNYGTVTNNSIINNTGTITHSSTIAFTNAASGTINNYITITISASRTLTNNGTIVNTGTINSGSTYGTLSFTNGSLYQHNYVSTGAAAGIVPASTWAAGSTCEILACGNSGIGPTGLAQTFSDFIWNNATQPLDVNLNAKLSSVRNFTIKNTNTYSVVLRASASGGTVTQTTVTADLIILPAGNLVLTNGDAGYTTSNHTISVAGNYVQTGGSCTLTNCSINTITPTTGGTGTFNLAGNLNMSAGTLNICASTAPGCFTGTVDGIFNITGNCTISGGTVNVNSSTATGGGGAGTMNIAGSFAHTGGTVTSTSLNPTTININGTSPQTIESIGFTAGSIVFNVQESGTGTASIANGKAFVLNSGTTFTLYDNASTGTDFTVNGTFITNTGTWALNTASASQTEVFGRFKNTVATLGTADSTTLKIRSGGVFEHAVNGGSVVVAAWHPLSVLDVTGMTSATGIANDNQVFGKILWESAAQTASASFGTTGFGVQTDYYVFDTGPVSPGTGKLRFPDVDFTIGSYTAFGGDLYVNNNARLQVSNAPLLYAPNYRTVTINGNVRLAGTASFIAVGIPDASATATQTSNKARNYVFAIKKNFYYTGGKFYSFDHKSYNGANNDEEYRLILNFNGGITQSLEEFASGTYAMTTLSGNGIANDATTDEFVLDTYPYRITVTGANTKLQPGAANTVFPYNTLTVGTAASTIDTLNFGSTATVNNLVHFSVIDSTGAKQYASATIYGSAVLDMGVSQLIEAGADTSSVKLLSLAEIRTKHVNGISGTAATGCLQHTGSRATLNANANYTYYGSTAQNTGNGLPATLTGVLEIDNSSALATGGVTLTRATSISGASGTRTLSLLTGKLLTTATNLITIGNGSAVAPAGGSATSFVDGPVRKVGLTAATAFVFPTGDTAKWAKIAITSPALSATADFTAEYYKKDPRVAVDSTMDVSLQKISYREYWKLARTGTTPSVTVKLYWENATFSGITSPTAADLRVAHYRTTGPKWYDQAPGAVTVSSSGSTGSIAINTGSEVNTTLTSTTPYFTFGSPTGVNPLPVELLAFNGTAESNGNLLHWETATETNNDHFELERSKDASSFTKVAVVNGHGTSTSELGYKQLDAAPLSGTNYYRLKQVDFNGDYTYSGIIAIDNSNQQASGVEVYPNPSNDLVHIAVSGNISSLVIYNMLGELVYSSEAMQSNVIDFTPLTNGVYIIKAMAENGEVINKRFIKYGDR